MSSIEELTQWLRAFADERDWVAFHTPKNLAMAAAGEMGELVAEFQWLTPEQSALSWTTRGPAPGYAPNSATSSST